MDEHAIENTPTDQRCTICGVGLTVREVEAAADAALPPLCAVHLAEREPVDVSEQENPLPPA
jgi:hypothetical protein